METAFTIRRKRQSRLQNLAPESHAASQVSEFDEVADECSMRMPRLEERVVQDVFVLVDDDGIVDH